MKPEVIASYNNLKVTLNGKVFSFILNDGLSANLDRSEVDNLICKLLPYYSGSKSSIKEILKRS